MRVHLIRPIVSVVVGISLTAAVLASPAAAHPHGPPRETYVFDGGGWGHGVGMSQYGALGRAEAGMTHAEILAFYYDGTELVTDAGLVPTSVDVRIAVHNSTVFTPTGTLTVAIDGSYLDTTVNQLTIRRGDGGWYINSSNIDWCRGFCAGTNLTVSFSDSEPVRVSNTANGTRRYGHGQFQLTPAAAGISNCGTSSANQYCLVIGDLTMKQYLLGLDEMPVTWPTEALKAQVIAGRSYATAQVNENRGSTAPFDLYTSTRDQEYRAWDFEMDSGDWSDSVEATANTVLVYDPDGSGADRQVIIAFYSSSNGGHTAANEEPRFESLPYLLATPDTYDAAPDADGNSKNPTHSWQRTYTAAQISGWLADYPFADLDVGDIEDIVIARPGPSGRIDDALVTLLGSERTVEVRRDNGDPYGYRFYYALVLGCRNTPGCQPVLSTKLMLQGAGDDGSNANPLPFTDVSAGAAYAEAVAWMLNNGITQGTTSTTYSPLEVVSRSEFATFLWRVAGEPAIAETADRFTDVGSETFYATAVAWMADEGITSGCSTDDDAMFCPHDPVSEKHMATFLWRFAGRKYSNQAIPFRDIGVNDYFLEPSRWMIEWDIWVDEDFILSDGTSTSFNPDESVSRARAATYLWRLAGMPEAFDTDAVLPPVMRTS